MYKNSGSQLFRATSGMQSRPDIFDKSKLVLTFLTNLRVTKILCSFRWVLDGTTSEGILSHQD